MRSGGVNNDPTRSNWIFRRSVTPDSFLSIRVNSRRGLQLWTISLRIPNSGDIARIRCATIWIRIFLHRNHIAWIRLCIHELAFDRKESAPAEVGRW